MIYNYCSKCGAKYDNQLEINKFKCSSCEYTVYLNSKPTVSAIIVKDGNVLLGKRGD